MITTALTLFIITSGIITGTILEVRFDDGTIATIEEMLYNLKSINGFIPILTILQAFALIIYVKIMFVVWKIVWGIIALINRSGKPEVSTE